MTCTHANTSIGHSFDNIITECDDCGAMLSQEHCSDCRMPLARGDDEPALHGARALRGIIVSVQHYHPADYGLVACLDVCDPEGPYYYDDIPESEGKANG